MVQAAIKTSPALSLRDYQAATLDAFTKAHARGVTRQLWSLPTGGGKTVVAAELVRRLGWQTVFIVHRDELVEQTRRQMGFINPGISVGVVKAERNDLHAPFIIASAQTLARQSRLDYLTRALNASRRPLLVISDEAHHDRAPGRQRALEALAPDLLVGLTATPSRGDELGLDAIYDEIVYHVSMLQLMRVGQLAQLVGLRVESEVDLDDVHTRAGEFVEGELAGAVDTDARNKLIVDSWQRHASARERTVVFCVNVAHAQNLASAFQHAGVDAEAILGETLSDERQRMLRDFHNGVLPVLSNCMVLTEGYDEPRIDCIVMARPVKSAGLYVQMVGRGARKDPHKPDCLVIDFVDNTTRHRLITLPTLAGKDEDAQGAEDDEKLRDEGELVSLLDMAQKVSRVREKRAYEVDLFGGSPYIWRESAGMYMVPLEKAWLVLRPAEDDLVIPTRVAGNPWEGYDVEDLFGRPVPAEMAMGIAESAGDLTPLNRREARWRDSKDVSEKQQAFARKLGVWKDGLTKGEVSARIDTKLFEQAARRLGWVQGGTNGRHR
jgi:superfamily II DNA or RNA helicase